MKAEKTNYSNYCISTGKLQIILLSLGLAGVLLVLLSTSKYGPGLSPDSTNYIAAARALLSGKGFLLNDGAIFTAWPPLYPFLIALLGYIGIEPITGAGIINALAFGAIIYTAGHLFEKNIKSRQLSIIGALFVLMSAPLLSVSVMVWSEPVFILLVLVFVLYAPKLITKGSSSRLLILSLIAALACLQRYVGVLVIFTGAVLIIFFMSNVKIYKRVVYLVGFVGLSVLPLIVWNLRNYILTAAPAGAHNFYLPSMYEFALSLTSATDIITGWLIPKVIPLPVRLTLILLFVSIILVINAFLKSQNPNIHIYSPIIFAILYFTFMISQRLGVRWIPIEERYMAPLYVFIIIFLFIGIERVSASLRQLPYIRKIISLFIIIFCCIWLTFPARCAYKIVRNRIKDGAGGYNSVSWRSSPLIKWLDSNPLQGNIYSNAPDVLYILAQIPAKISPPNHWDFSEFIKSLPRNENNYLIWFNDIKRYYLYDMRQIILQSEIGKIAVFSDGRIYRFFDEKDPGTLPVYRLWSGTYKKHLYTISDNEKNKLIEDVKNWSYEGVAWHAFAKNNRNNLKPIHRLWSSTLNAHFYTIDETEKNKLVENNSGFWIYESIAFYAYSKDTRPEGTKPVHRFWSSSFNDHFYSLNNTEKKRLIENSQHPWTYEGIAWYAYENSE